MARETKSGGATVETDLAPTLKNKFKRKCDKQNISMAQVLRDLIQKYVQK